MTEIPRWVKSAEHQVEDTWSDLARLASNLTVQSDHLPTGFQQTSTIGNGPRSVEPEDSSRAPKTVDERIKSHVELSQVQRNWLTTVEHAVLARDCKTVDGEIRGYYQTHSNSQFKAIVPYLQSDLKALGISISPDLSKWQGHFLEVSAADTGVIFYSQDAVPNLSKTNSDLITQYHGDIAPNPCNASSHSTSIRARSQTTISGKQPAVFASQIVKNAPQ
jgi:hypothetical protein